MMRPSLLLSLFLCVIAGCSNTHKSVRQKTESQINKSRSIPLDLIEPAHFLNAHRQPHPPPDNDALSFTYEVADGGETMTLQLGIRAEEPRERAHRPLNLCVVIDKSRSMHDNGRMEMAKEAAREIIRLLHSEDVVSIVSYDSRSVVLLEPSLAVSRAAINLHIDNIIPGGGSDPVPAILLGLEQLERMRSRERVNRMVIVTDSGVGGIDEAAGTAIRRATVHGVITSVIGIGTAFHDPLLYKIAAESGGNYYVASLPGEAAQAAAEEMAPVSYAPADNIRLLLVLKDGVRIEEVHGYPFHAERPLNIRIEVFPQMVCGSTQTVLIRLRTPPEADLLGTATIYYHDSLGLSEKSREIFLRIPTDGKLRDNVRRNLALAGEAASVRRARALERKGDYHGALTEIDATIGELQPFVKLHGDEEIAADVERLRIYREHLSETAQRTPVAK